MLHLNQFLKLITEAKKHIKEENGMTEKRYKGRGEGKRKGK
jgi:hypothetical protein